MQCTGPNQILYPLEPRLRPTSENVFEKATLKVVLIFRITAHRKDALMNDAQYIGLDVRQATISATVLELADDPEKPPTKGCNA